LNFPFGHVVEHAFSFRKLPEEQEVQSFSVEFEQVKQFALQESQVLEVEF